MLDIRPSPIVPRYAFESGDRVAIGDKEFTVGERRGDRVVFYSVDSRGITTELSDTELGRLSRMGKLRHDPMRVEKPADDFLDADVAAFLASRSAKQTAWADKMESIVLLFLAWHAQGLVKRTYASIDAKMKDILTEAAEINADPWDEDAPRHRKFSAKSLLRYVQKYERYGRRGLFKGFKGNRAPRLQPEAHGIMNQIVQGYMDPLEPTQAIIFERVQGAIKAANVERREMGMVELVPPSRETVRKAISALDPFLVCLKRKGPKEAKQKFAPVGRGLRVERPLQRVEIDEWTADIVVLLGKCGLLEHLDAETRARIKAKDGKARVRVTVVIDCATRCILAMRISPEANTRSTLETIEMILDDKGVYADAVGALNPWHMAGTPSLIVTDCARYYTCQESRRAIAAIGSRLEHCPAGEPEMKATIERLFGTISTRLLPRLHGRTMHDVVARGDRDPHKDAALELEDFADVLVRWVVDVYHSTPHLGLNGKTPLDAWEELTARHGVRPAPSKQARMLAFGQEETRTLQKAGLTFLNIRYHSEALAGLMLRESDRSVTLRWYPADLGSVMALIDGEWHEVKAVDEIFEGVSAANWEAVCRSLRARNKANATVYADAVAEALRNIDEISARAARRGGILVEHWTPTRVSKMEGSLFIGFDLSRNADQSDAARHSDGFGTDLSGSACSVHAAEALNDHADGSDTAGGASSKAFRDETPVDCSTADLPDANGRMSEKGQVGHQETSTSETSRHGAVDRSTRRNTARGRRGTDDNDLGISFE